MCRAETPKWGAPWRGAPKQCAPKRGAPKPVAPMPAVQMAMRHSVAQRKLAAGWRVGVDRGLGLAAVGRVCRPEFHMITGWRHIWLQAGVMISQATS